MSDDLRVMISGGGTGGHIFPAIAIANAIKAQAPETKFQFVGAQGRMEMEKVPAAGYAIEGLWISGLQRKFNLDNLIFPAKVFSSLYKSHRLLDQFKPHVVVGVGGYASGPLLFAASERYIPTLIQEQNSFPGITNRLLSKRVNKICVAYKNMEQFFPSDSLLFTGNPVRLEITQSTKINKITARDFFQLDKTKPCLLVVGGSLGAYTINESIKENIKKLVAEGLQIIWQTGQSYFNTAQESIAECSADVKVFQFIKEMDMAYAASDVVVSRAGALAISELCCVQKPCILVPSPNVAEDHQTKNALALVIANAAILVKDKEAKGNLATEIIRLKNDTKLQTELANNMAPLAKADAAAQIAEQVFELAKIMGYGN